MSDGAWIGLGIAVAGIALAAGLGFAARAFRKELSEIVARTFVATGEIVAMAVREHADGQADSATTAAHARVRAAKIAAGLFKRPPEAPAEPTVEEQRVRDFMDSSGAKLSEEDQLSVEWAYGRLRGLDKDEGSFEEAVEILRQHGAPIPQELRPMVSEPMGR